MKKLFALVVLTGLLTLSLAPCLLADTQEWEFSKATRIKVKGISGDVVLRPAEGRTGIIELRADVRPERSFRPEVDIEGGSITIREHWSGNNSRGVVEWIIYLPDQEDMVAVRINNASGDLDCRGVRVRIDYETASGDIDLFNVELGEGSDFSTASGDYTIEEMTVSEDADFSTASGDYDLEDLTIGEGCRFSSASGNVRSRNCICMDEVELSSASGDVIVEDTELRGWCEFSSASGDVELYFDELPDQGFKGGSASGDVLLDVRDFGEDYTLVLVKREDMGRISCPFRFTDEDTFEDYQTYERKYVEKGSGKPEIELRTASGRVTVRD